MLKAQVCCVLVSMLHVLSMREAVAAAMADGVTESGSQLHPLPQRLFNMSHSDVGMTGHVALFSGNIFLLTSVLP